MYPGSEIFRCVLHYLSVFCDSETTEQTLNYPKLRYTSSTCSNGGNELFANFSFAMDIPAITGKSLKKYLKCFFCHAIRFLNLFCYFSIFIVENYEIEFIYYDFRNCYSFNLSSSASSSLVRIKCKHLHMTITPVVVLHQTFIAVQ